MFDLGGRIALVTGASRGIGREIALTLAAQGAQVVLAARSQEALEGVAREIGDKGGRAHALALDLSEPEGVAQAIGGLPQELSSVDILVNNAGVTADGLLARMKLEQWEKVLATNLTGAFAVTHALLRGMMKRRWGRIINITSVVGLMGNPGQSNYASSKAGLVGFTKSLAQEVGSRGITVNAVAPGYVETDMTAELGASARDKLLTQVPLARTGTTQDVAAAVIYLASEEASYVTGHVLNVSGGLYM